MKEVLLSLALILSAQAESTDYLARCIQGEIGPFFPANRDVVGLWIGHVMLNRVSSRWFPNDIPSVVMRGCRGYANVEEPDPWATSLALRAQGEEDSTGGCYFFLSGDDLRNHGWSGKSSVKDFYGVRGSSFHFFKKWVE